MLAELAGRKSAGTGTLLRYAEVLYTRARGNDRARAEVVYHHIAADRQADLGTRLMCRLRSGDISRGRTIRDSKLTCPAPVISQPSSPLWQPPRKTCQAPVASLRKPATAC